MPNPSPGAITAELESLGQGSPEAMARLVPLVYDELHRLAGGHMRGERASHTLQTTALVHEAFLRMQARFNPDVRTRAQFYALAARIMRSILVDHARARAAQKRGGGEQGRRDAVPMTGSIDLPAPSTPLALESVLDIHHSIQALEAEDPHLARLVEMRFFAGMSAEDAAEALDISVHTIRHDMRLARAWLKERLVRDKAAVHRETRKGPAK